MNVELNHTLQAHIVKGVIPGTRMIAHPLLYVIQYDRDQNPNYNRRLEEKEKARAHAIREGDFHTAIFLHERPHRLNALMALHATLLMEPQGGTLIHHANAGEMLGRCLPQVYIDAEGIHVNASEWRTLFMALPEEYRNLDLLPPGEFDIWRGVQDTRPIDSGISWTLSEDRARWFARRYGGDRGQTQQRTVTAQDVAYYTDERGEQDVVYFAR